MKNMSIKNILLAFVAMVMISSCSKQLDLFPQNDLTSEDVYATPAGYRQVLAKIYGGLATTGNVGPAGASDIQGLDEGSQSPFLRGFFNCQELTTDEAVVSWNDQTIKDFHNLSYSSADPFLKGMYARPIYNIMVANSTYVNPATPSWRLVRSPVPMRRPSRLPVPRYVSCVHSTIG